MHVGTPYCINGHGAITASSVEQIVNQVLGTQRFANLAPCSQEKGQHKANNFEKIQKTDTCVCAWTEMFMMSQEVQSSLSKTRYQ